MKHVFGTFTYALAGLAVAGLPILAEAQSTPSQTGRPPADQDRSHATTDRAGQNSPRHHLDEAKRVLNGIDAKQEAAPRISEIRREFEQLERAWSSRSTSASSGHSTGHATGTSGTTPPSPEATERPSSPRGTQPGTTAGTAADSAWQKHYEAIDASLSRLIGARDNARSTTPAAGTTDSTATAKLDAQTKDKLSEFRRHLDQFHATAMAGARNRGEEDRASHQAHSGITGAGTATGSPAQTESGRTYGTATANASQTDADRDRAIVVILASFDEMMRPTAAGESPRPAGTSGSASEAGASGTVCVDRAKLEALKRDIDALRTRK